MKSDYPELPIDFDTKVYLKLHPDVAMAGVDPAYHYANFGRAKADNILSCLLPK